MDSLLRGIVLGLIQGVTEFFPVSSSGHEVVLGSLLTGEQATIGEIAMLHAGTAVGLLLNYRAVLGNEVGNIFREPLLPFGSKAVVITTATSIFLIGGMAQILNEDEVSVRVVGFFFLLNAALLAISGQIRDNPENLVLGARKAIFVGVFQAIAVLPGLSRLGLTMAAARLSGASYEQARVFSLQLAYPILLLAVPGSLLLDLVSDNVQQGPSFSLDAVVGGFVAALSAYISLKFFLRITQGWATTVFVCWSLLIAFVAIAVV